MKKFSLLSALVLMAGLLNAQLPDSIVNKIRAAPKKDVVSVIGRMEFSGQVIRAENLVFHNNSELVLTNYNVPYIIIAVKNLKFNAPAIKSAVRFGQPDLSSLNGSKGSAGSNGANGTGNGGNGGNGTDGGTGTKGGTLHTPDIYLVVENINTDYGDITTFDWQVFANGFKGAKGGEGGNGGAGGGGAKGRNSRSNVFHCTRGAGNGGNGGRGGRGGAGGEGGDGGNAGNIYLVGTSTITEKLTYVQYSLNGGEAGDGGDAGASGNGGGAGGGGNGSTHCSGGDKGSAGQKPAPIGAGNPGTKGKNGEVKIINTSIVSLF
jgi:hypothetical protein